MAWIESHTLLKSIYFKLTKTWHEEDVEVVKRVSQRNQQSSVVVRSEHFYTTRLNVTGSWADGASISQHDWAWMRQLRWISRCEQDCTALPSQIHTKWYSDHIKQGFVIKLKQYCLYLGDAKYIHIFLMVLRQFMTHIFLFSELNY